jgi:hypothetical protein
MVAVYGLQGVNGVQRLFAGTLTDQRTASVRALETTIRKHNEARVPVVVSDPHQYLPLTRYATRDTRDTLYALVDPESAISYIGIDSSDRNLQLLRRYVSLRVVDYADFAAVHPKFVLVSSGNWLDWWPARLVRDGHQVTLLADESGARLYRVVLVANAVK